MNPDYFISIGLFLFNFVLVLKLFKSLICSIEIYHKFVLSSFEILVILLGCLDLLIDLNLLEQLYEEFCVRCSRSIALFIVEVLYEKLEQLKYFVKADFIQVEVVEIFNCIFNKFGLVES